MKVLQVVEQAYRTLAEEQDDTILWLTQSMHGAGADLCVLLAGHCAYYAIQRGRQPALKLGAWQQLEPADLVRDLDSLLQKGVDVYVVREELEERGLNHLSVHPGIKIIDKNKVHELYDQVDQVWQW
jgi:sulfur relay (sulfurtransferase) DsrF/TusC family protein